MKKYKSKSNKPVNNKPTKPIKQTITIKNTKKINNNYIKGVKYTMLSRKIYYKTRYNQDIKANPRVKLILKTKLKKQLDYKLLNHQVFNATRTKQIRRL